MQEDLNTRGPYIDPNFVFLPAFHLLVWNLQNPLGAVEKAEGELNLRTCKETMDLSEDWNEHDEIRLNFHFQRREEWEVGKLFGRQMIPLDSGVQTHSKT